jgi:hypothetical protein
LPPALDSTSVSLIAETSPNDEGRTAGGEGGDGADPRLQHAGGAVPIIATPMIAKPVSDTLDALSAARSTQVRCCGTADIDHLQFDACF